MTTNLRAAILCSGDSSSLRTLIKCIEQFAISIDLIIYNKNNADSDIFTSLAPQANLCFIPDNGDIGTYEYEKSILEELRSDRIDIVFVVNWSYLFRTDILFDQFKDKILTIVSPLNTYQYEKEVSAKNIYMWRWVVFDIYTHYGRKGHQSERQCISITIPNHIRDGNSLEEIEKRIANNEPILISASILASLENYWL